MVRENTSGGCASGGCGSGGGDDRCGNGLEKIYPTTAIRYGVMAYIGEFTHKPKVKFTCGAKVVIQTHRGLEIGEQVSLTCHSCEKSVSRSQMKEYVKNSGNDYLRSRNGRILREATPEDLAEERHIVAAAREKLRFCQAQADEANLPMKLVECEHLFGGERIVFYFRVRGEGRVDFRELVRELAAEFQTRIEMRQVGARDEARLVADYETCGRECCCKNFLKTLKPISMRMAKMQRATLDPSKVAGRCGRLKCCLRYEHEGYEELAAKLPKMGTRIRTAHGTGVVVDRQILTQLVQIRGDDNKRITVVIEDILERDVAASESQPHSPAPPPQRERGGRRERPARQEEPARPPQADRPEQAGRKEQGEDGPGDGSRGGGRRRRRRGRSRGRGGRADGSATPTPENNPEAKGGDPGRAAPPPDAPQTPGS